MFSFFSNKKKLVNTGILKGATDWHCHILPGVDDGIQKIEDSLAALSYYEEIGISEVWLTPHIMEDMPNTTDELRTRFQKLQEAYNGKIKLHLAAENMIDNLFQPPIDLYDTLKRIKELGYTPILAHPERYRYMRDSDYDYLHSHEVKLQMNLLSLVGGYGKPAQEKSQMLLTKGYYNFFGSDLHFLPTFQQGIQAKALKPEFVEFLPGIQNMIMEKD